MPKLRPQHIAFDRGAGSCKYHKILWLALVLAFLALAGCAGSENKVITYDKNGQKVENTLSDEAMYYFSQVQFTQSRKPILVMEAKDGEVIELKGVKSLTVWGYANDRGRLPSYEHPWAKSIMNGLGVVGSLGAIAVGGYWANQLVDTAGKHAGAHFNDSFKTTGDYSPPSYITGGGSFTANPSTSPPTVVTQPEPVVVNPVVVEK